jgi:hypothetical protein
MRYPISIPNLIAATAIITACHKQQTTPPAAPTPAATSSAAGSVAAPATAAAGSLNDMVSSGLGLSSAQANGGIGSILAYAQSKLAPADYSKVAASIPGASNYVQAAKDAGAVTGPIADQGGLTAAFAKLGISPDVGSQLVQQVSAYASKVGGPEVGQLLSGLMK